MPVKTILVHMSDDERHSVRLRFAIGLAKRFGAFLDILYNTTPVNMPEAATGRAASLSYIAELEFLAEQKSQQIKQEVADTCGDMEYRWSVTEGDHAVKLAERALYVDLAIITQAHPKFLEDRVIPEHLPDRLPLLSPGPTLILPWSSPGESALRRILVAWKPCREASRAMRDAMPFLKQAEQVIILAANRARSAEEQLKESLSSLQGFLQHQGISVELIVQPRSRAHAGQKILEAMKELHCDMLVMGSYGHTRWREVVLGGSTRTVLGGMIAPVLMSH